MTLSYRKRDLSGDNSVFAWHPFRTLEIPIGFEMRTEYAETTESSSLMKFLICKIKSCHESRVAYLHLRNEYAPISVDFCG